MTSRWAASYTTSPLRDANTTNSRSQTLRNTPAPVIPSHSPFRTPPVTSTRLDSRPNTPYPHRRFITEAPHSAWNQWHRPPVYSQQSASRPHTPRQASHRTGETQLLHHPRSRSPQSPARRERCSSVHIHLSWPPQGDLSTRTPEIRLLDSHAFDMEAASSFSSRSVSSGSSASAEMPESQHERPQQWRDDFHFKSGSVSKFRNTINTSRASYGVVDIANPVLHPLLHHNKSHRIIIYDLRREPTTLLLRESGRSLPKNATVHPVTHPPSKSICIYHPRLPWHIDIKAHTSPYLSLDDFFLQLFAALNKPISKYDFYNDNLGDEDRRVLTHTFHRRCRCKEEKMQGVKWVDFLLGKTEWMGLVAGKDGMWRLKTG